MTWVVPAPVFVFCSWLWGLASCRDRTRIASSCAHQPIDHEFERTWRLVPIDRTNNHDAVCRRPLRVNFCHPVAYLPHSVIGITGTRPMTKRHRGRNTCLARIDDPSIFRGESA